ncbi:MAG: hypothetical protein HQM11_16490 [SAR324 cluster bacterium]|nr:hypothetical protein [SAR324 cluster bacterium]
MALTAKLLSAGLVGQVGQLKNLVKIEGQQCKKIHVEAEIGFTVAVVMLKTIALILECIETLIFNLPPFSGAFNQDFNVVRIHGKIGDPTALEINFFFSLFVYRDDSVWVFMSSPVFRVIGRTYLHSLRESILKKYTEKNIRSSRLIQQYRIKKVHP